VRVSSGALKSRASMPGMALSFLNDWVYAES
jgi:hypothetical protein